MKKISLIMATAIAAFGINYAAAKSHNIPALNKATLLTGNLTVNQDTVPKKQKLKKRLHLCLQPQQVAPLCQRCQQAQQRLLYRRTQQHQQTQRHQPVLQTQRYQQAQHANSTTAPTMPSPNPSVPPTGTTTPTPTGTPTGNSQTRLPTTSPTAPSTTPVGAPTVPRTGGR
jgi:hypothetical protein